LDFDIRKEIILEAMFLLHGYTNSKSICIYLGCLVKNNKVVLYNILKSVPENGAFDISDASGNTLYAPSRVSRAVKELVDMGAIERIEATGLRNSKSVIYKLTDEGIQLKKGIAKADLTRSRGYGI
jgi:DNA-binding MarR family transcriptional regulator